jgi:hypothetical protein
MFVGFELIGQLLEQGCPYNMRVVDSTFTEEVELIFNNGIKWPGDFVLAFIIAYEKHDLNIAANLAYACKVCKFNPDDLKCIEKYRKDMEKYLILL